MKQHEFVKRILRELTSCAQGTLLSASAGLGISRNGHGS